MKVTLEVIEGPYKGTVFTFTKPDCFLIGRDAPECKAHFRLERGKDMYVSRNHLLIEIRPPRCFIRDNNSTNGTYLKKVTEREFKRINEAEVHDGDLIKIGKTVFQVGISVEEKRERFFCIRCGADITDLIEAKDLEAIDAESYLCGACKAKISKPEVSVKERFYCLSCRADVTDIANSDKRAGELKDIVHYLCRKCADKEKGPVDIKEIKDYVLLKKLGEGGMGVVYKAWHKPTGRLVALKKILPNAAMNEKSLKLFQREISVHKELVHKNIIYLIDHGTVKNEPFFVCEYATDGNVWDLLVETYKRPLPIELACDIICQILDGFEYAHGKGYIHRDVKPQNMLLVRKGNQYVAKISDFGLAKSYETAGLSGITKQGEVAGTLLFMAPEQIINYKYVKPPADLYSVGVSLYFLLTGRFPYYFPSPLDQLVMALKGEKPKDPVLIILEDAPIPIRERNPEIPGRLADVVDKSIRKDPDKRYQTAREFKEEILKALKK